jgi:hypothetical protein
VWRSPSAFRRFRLAAFLISLFEFSPTKTRIVQITNQSPQALCGSFSELIKVGEHFRFQISKIKSINKLAPSFAYRSFRDRNELSKLPAPLKPIKLSKIIHGEHYHNKEIKSSDKLRSSKTVNAKRRTANAEPKKSIDESIRLPIVGCRLT